MERKWSKEDKDFIINKYTIDGWTLKEIGRKFSAKPDTISKYLKLWGYQIKNKNVSKNRRLKENYFEQIDSEEKAYFLGLLFTDGSIVNDATGRRSPQISLELVETDKEILDKFKKELCSDSSLYYNKRANRKNGTFSFSIRNAKMAEDLSCFNIIPNKTYKINHLVLPKGYEIPYLRGFVDGDGSIYCDKIGWHLSLTSHSKDILIQLREFIENLIDKKKTNTITCYNNVYKYTLNGQYAIKLMEILYKNAKISIARKQEKARLAIEGKRVEDIVYSL